MVARYDHGMKKIAVFCGSSLGGDVRYGHAAAGLGGLLAQRGIGLVYGGGNIGLMGRVATAALEAGGHVTGVIPRFLMEKEIGRIDLPELRVPERVQPGLVSQARSAQTQVLGPGWPERVPV